MKRKHLLLPVTLCIITLALLSLRPSLAQKDEVITLRESLRSQLYLAQTYSNYHIMTEELRAFHLLMDFYEQREYQPAWMENGHLSKAGATLFSLLWDSYQEGLYPKDYHLQTIHGLWLTLQTEGESIDGSQLIQIDLLLTDAFFIYASDLKEGRINAQSLEREWVKGTSNYLVGYLKEILEHEDPPLQLQLIGPSNQDYINLLKSLSAYRSIVDQGGWPLLPEGRVLKEGDQGEGVLLLRQRLLQEPFLKRNLSYERDDYFDGELKKAVMDFQGRHGLRVTGELDEETRGSLNIPAQTIVHLILINLERWRWLPPSMEERYLLVNIPDYRLKVIEDGEKVMDMKIIIGHDKQKTPVFNSRISHLVLSPRWYIPTSLTIRSYLPMVQEDPKRLEEMHIRVFRRKDGGFEEVDPYGIHWHKIDEKNFNYFFWQDPGPWNRLGEVIFMFPNPYQVYLHDTPDKYLFEREVRTFSEGCIRIEKPMELALYLLPNHWSIDGIKEIVKRQVEYTVFLKESVPIFIYYRTAWVDDGGSLQLRKDVYQWDKGLKDKILASMSG